LYFQDNHISNWNEDYLTENEDRQWGDAIFKNMQLQQIQEPTMVEEEDQSNTTSEVTRTNAESLDTHQVPSEKQDSTETDADKELTEQEIEAFIISEQIVASEGNNADLNSIYTPQLGMEFESKDAAEHFFNFYASLAGFKTVVVHVARTSSLKRDNEMIRTTVKCNRYGKPPVKKNTEQKEAQVDEQIGKKKRNQGGLMS